MGTPTKKPIRQFYPRHPFLLSLEEIFEQLGTNVDTGLSRLKAQQSQHDYGPNKLKGEGAIQWYSILVKQISNAMILVRLRKSHQAFSTHVRSQMKPPKIA